MGDRARLCEVLGHWRALAVTHLWHGAAPSLTVVMLRCMSGGSTTLHSVCSRLKPLSCELRFAVQRDLGPILWHYVIAGDLHDAPA